MTKTINDLITQQEQHPASLSVDEVARIVQHCKALREALEPFKGVVDTFLGGQPSNERHVTVYETPYQKPDGYRAGNFTLGDLRRVDKILGE